MIRHLVLFGVILGVLLGWGWFVIEGRILVADGEIVKWGTFGDFFGCFNALVSVVGFGAVIYSLQRQHKDAKDADDRHQAMLDKQQELFEQNAKIELFEKRFEVYSAVLQFCDNIGNNRQPKAIDFDLLRTPRTKVPYLFSNGQELLAYIVKLRKRAYKLEVLIGPIENINRDEKQFSEIRELCVWFRNQIVVIEDLFSKDLCLIDKNPNTLAD